MAEAEPKEVLVDELRRPRQPIRDCLCGKVRKWEDLDKKEVAFMVIASGGMIIAMALTLYKIITAKGDDQTFALVLFINIAFCLYYVNNGVITENPFQVLVLIIGAVVLLLYVTINFGTKPNKSDGYVDVVKLIRLILVWLIGPFVVALGVYFTKGYFESNSFVSRVVENAKLEIQKACKIIYLTRSLLVFDFQLTVNLVVLVFRAPVIGKNVVDLAEKIALGLGIAISVMWLILGSLCMRLEKRPLVWVFLATSVIAPAYACYIIKRAKDHMSSKAASEALSGVTYLAAALAIIIRAMLIVSMVFVYRNFGQGLNKKVYGGVINAHPEIDNAEGSSV